MKRLLLIVAVSASACDAAAQSSGAPSIRSESPTTSSPTSPEGIDKAVAEEALRRAVWHSTEMLDARAYVLTYAERSARSSRAQGEQYLRRVSQLSSEQMTEWLQRLQRQRAELEGRRLAEADARELTLRLSEERSRLIAEAGFNVQQTKARLTDLWLQRQAELAAPLSSRRDQRAAAAAGLRLAYDPMAPALDPASPPRTERAMAAASLPGDLPRGDPANFYRGDDRGGGIVIPTGGGVADAGGAGGGAASAGDAGGAAGSEAGGGGE